MAFKRTLLVEGIDDVNVLKHLCGNRGLPKLDDIKSHGGVDKLLESFPVRLKASEDGDIVGLVIDADMDLSSRWQSLRKHLSDVGYQNLPAEPSPEGSIFDPPAGILLPRVGIWIMPNNQTKGILEDFLRFLIPEGSRLFDHVQSSVDSIPEDEKRFRKIDKPKAIIHTWLAWQKEPGKPLGTAITANFITPHAAQADNLIAWLNRLFFNNS